MSISSWTVLSACHTHLSSQKRWCRLKLPSSTHSNLLSNISDIFLRTELLSRMIQSSSVITYTLISWIRLWDVQTWIIWIQSFICFTSIINTQSLVKQQHHLEEPFPDLINWLKTTSSVAISLLDLRIITRHLQCNNIIVLHFWIYKKNLLSFCTLFSIILQYVKFSH